MRDKKEVRYKWQKKMYSIFALNWNGSEFQKKLLNRSVIILAVLIIPVAFGIHTVTSWLFATTFRPGWDSTNFGPYFVSGAFMVGAGSVICAMYVFRRGYGLKHYITDDIFNKMGKLLVLLSLVYLYFNINEYFTPAYKMKGPERDHLEALFYGEYSVMFWTVQILGMIVPIIVLLFKKGRKPLPMFIISVLVIVWAWFKRFLIVVPTLSHPLIPVGGSSKYLLHYVPTFAELCITGATLAGALLIMTVIARYFPFIPIVETLELKAEENGKK